MLKNQNKRAGIIIDDRRTFRAAQKREILFQIRGSATTSAVRESIFKIVVLRSDSRNSFHDGRAQWRTTEIRVHENAGAIDQWLETRCAQGLQSGTQAREDFFVWGNGSVFAQRSQFAPNRLHHDRVRKSRVAESLGKSVDGGNAAKCGAFHADTLILGFFDATMFPITAALDT
jgi:hypothetical protein